ncbi:MAG: YbaK/EbsC family protein [Chloroflexi bacterium]|nr:YbaK/EbsC family protein [Chloroflexota bacterium]
MAESLSDSAKRVQQALKAIGFELRVVEMPDSTRTSVEAAQAVGCEVAQIAKSLVFKAASGRAVLVIASGMNRVNEKRVAAELGESLGKADADFVRQQTGFAIGGIPPVGHIQPLETFMDEDLLQFETIWAAAGTPHAVFQLTPAELQKMTGARVIGVK